MLASYNISYCPCPQTEDHYFLGHGLVEDFDFQPTFKVFLTHNQSSIIRLPPKAHSLFVAILPL